MTRTDITHRVNREVMRRINREVSLRATRFANALLSGVFRAIFHVEKSYEYAEPEIFSLEHDPDRIMWKRLDDNQLRYLPLAIANEEVLASRHQVFTEYDFVIVADISHSMLFRWWEVYGGEPMNSSAKSGEFADSSVRSGDREYFEERWRVPGDRSKLFLLKYTLAAFLRAARNNDFYCHVVLFGGGVVECYDSRQELHLEETLLDQIDARCEKITRLAVEERPLMEEALRLVLARRRRAIVLCISDFADYLRHLNEDHPRIALNEASLPLAEIATQHRLLVLQIMDRRELEPQEMRGSALLDTKSNAYLHGEIAGKRLHEVREGELLAYAQAVQDWQQELQSYMRCFGIKCQLLVAGKDDEQIDRKIYELGIETGTT